MIGDDKVLKQVTGRLGGLCKLVGKQDLGDLGALAHDSQVDWQLRVVLGEGEGDIKALIPDLLHALLVDDSPDKSIIGALGVLGPQLSGTRDTWHRQGLLAVKGVDRCLHGILGRGEAIEEKAQAPLGDRHERVESADQAELRIHKGNVLAAGSVGGELEQGLLLERLLRLRKVSDEEISLAIAAASRGAAEADESKLGGQSLGVRLDPLPGLAPVQARADDV